MENPMALIEQLLSDYKKPEDIIGENGLLKELTKAILERALEAEIREARPGGPPSGEHAQREKPKDIKGRVWRVGVGNSAGPQGDL